MTPRGDRAEEFFMEGYNCAQSVFAAFADRYGITKQQALSMMQPMGAGVSAMREVCGAVSAMSLICGLEEGSCDPSQMKKKEVYEANRRNLDTFTESFGSIVCRDILKLRADEKRQDPSVRTQEYYRKRPCLEVVRRAAEILEAVYPEPDI